MKKTGFNPSILMSTYFSESSGTVIGGASGHGSTDPINANPCSYDFWLEHYATEEMDSLHNGYDPYDFADWWMSCEFTKEDWVNLNPDLPWDDYFGD